MTTSATDLTSAALARSFSNRPELSDPASAELVSVLSRQFKELFALASTINPGFFGASVAVPFQAGPGASSSGWPRPADAHAVFKLEASTDTKDAVNVTIPLATEILIVPFNDRAFEAGTPAVYELGQLFVSAGNAGAPGDPASGGLVVYYQKRPTSLVNGGDAIDALWPEEFNELLILGVAAYLAKKDGRAEDVQAFSDERQEWLALYAQSLRDASISTRQRFGQFRPVPRESGRAEDQASDA